MASIKKSGKKTVGVALPPRHPSHNVIEGSGLMHDDVRARLLAALDSDPSIGEVVLCDLSAAYVRDGKVYEGGRCLSDLDLVHWYFATHVPESWSVIMLRALAQSTKVVPDPAGLLMGLDKFYAHTALRHANLPTANFSLFRAAAVNKVADQLCGNGPILLKPRLGAFGHGIHMVNTAQEFIDAVQYGQSFVKDEMQIFCEFFEENDISRWISTTIIGGELVYGYRKKPEKFVDNWKVYDPTRTGGGVDYVDATPVKSIALAAAKTLGCDIIGFDFIYSTAKREYLIVDENTFPGMYPHCFAESGTGSWDQHFHRMIRNSL
jgi:ribosomal protein S6--L-glutamate ligase